MSTLQYQVDQQIYDSKSHLDEQNFYHQNQGKPAELTKKLVYILGNYTDNYPISMLTNSDMVSNKAMKEVDDPQYKYPIMGKDTKASVVVDTIYTGTDKPGIGNSEFKIILDDNWIKRFYIIQSTRGVQAYVLKDAEKVGAGWEYTVQLHAANDEQFCPLSEVESGTRWVGLTAQVAESESRGTESKMAAPGSWKNQIGYVRASGSWAGNSANKVMNMTVSKNGKTTDVWMDYWMWQFEKRWLSECENAYWYSRYNRKGDGSIALKDPKTGKVIPTGSGILEQIQNKDTFTKLTYNQLSNKIGDALFGQTDTKDMTITLYTGKGGMRDIDRAMKEEGVKFLTDFTGVADKFVTGQDRDIMLGGFFNGFYHIDGYTIKVKYNPLFDHGEVAQASETHPDTGFPLESHRMVFLDDAVYEGEPNVQLIAEKGRYYLHGIVPGMTPAPKSLNIMGGGVSMSNDAVGMLATDKDTSSYHRFKSMGVQLLRATKCFDLQCVSGL